MYQAYTLLPAFPLSIRVKAIPILMFGLLCFLLPVLSAQKLSLQGSIGRHTFFNDVSYGGRVGMKVCERFSVYGDYMLERSKYAGLGPDFGNRLPALAVIGQYPTAFERNVVDVNGVPLGQTVASRSIDFYHSFTLGAAYRIPGGGRFSFEVYAGVGYLMRNIRTATSALSPVRLADRSEFTESYLLLSYAKTTRIRLGGNVGGVVLYRLTPNSQLGFDQRFGLGENFGINSMLVLRSNLKLKAASKAQPLASGEDAEEGSLAFRLGLGFEGGYSRNHQLYGIGFLPSLSITKGRFNATYAVGQLNYQGNPSDYNLSNSNVRQTYSTLEFHEANKTQGNLKSWTIRPAVDHSTVFVNRLTVGYEVLPYSNASLGLFAGYSYRKFHDLTVGRDLGLQNIGNANFVDLLVPVDLRYDVWQTELGARLNISTRGRLSGYIGAGVSTNFRWSTQLALTAGTQIRI